MPLNPSDFLQFYSAIRATSAGQVQITVTGTSSSSQHPSDLSQALSAFQNIPEAERTPDRATFSIGRAVESDFPILSLRDDED